MALINNCSDVWTPSTCGPLGCFVTAGVVNAAQEWHKATAHAQCAKLLWNKVVPRRRAGTETGSTPRPQVPAHRTAPHFTTGRNATFSGLDINTTCGEPARGKTGVSGRFQGLTWRENRLYFYKQRHQLHKERSGDPVLVHGDAASLPETLNFRGVLVCRTCGARPDTLRSCCRYSVLILGEVHGKWTRCGSPSFRKRQWPNFYSQKS